VKEQAMTTVTAVIGANFGDEGKGLMTDALASRKPAHTLVVRANGGAQAGHTVVTPEGRRHVFGHVGSGTFCEATTLLSRYFVSHPLLLDKEWRALSDLAPRVLVDGRSLVTTPFDMLVNQMVERSRGTRRHGSCGVGFHETIERSLRPEFRIHVKDMARTDRLRERLETIRHVYLPERLSTLDLTPDAREQELLQSPSLATAFQDSAQRFLQRVQVIPDLEALAAFDHAIFEGAQGLLLDEDHPWFPHVTHSKTGLKNVVALMQEANLNELNAVYVTRWYMTRHGAGPFPSELAGKPSLAIQDRTNLPNDWQGSLRFGLLDLDTLRESIHADLCHANGMNVDASIAITCLDQMGSLSHFRVADGNNLLSVNPFSAAACLEQRVGLKVAFTAWGPTRMNLRVPTSRWVSKVS
jgi:adenylosuccinate synthase